MTEQEQRSLACELSALSVFRGILKYNTMSAFIEFLNTKENRQKKLELFGEFVYSLSEDNYCFSDFLCRTVYSDENKYIFRHFFAKILPNSRQILAKTALGKLNNYKCGL